MERGKLAFPRMMDSVFWKSEQLKPPSIFVAHQLGVFSFTLKDDLGSTWYTDMLPSRNKQKRHKRKPNQALEAFISDAFLLGLDTLPPNNNWVVRDVHSLVSIGLYAQKPSIAQTFGAKPQNPHIVIRYKEAMQNELTHKIEVFHGRYGFVELEQMKRFGYEIAVS